MGSEILNKFIITNVELHACFVFLIVLLFFNMRLSAKRNGRKADGALSSAYILSALMLISDCCWTTVSYLGNPGDFLAYFINLVYFVASTLGSACWYIFCTRQIDTKLSANKTLRRALLIPCFVVIILYLISPLNGCIFYIQDGEYIRGSLFFLDPVVKLFYICGSSWLALRSGLRKEHGYQRRRDIDLALYGVPVTFCGLLQIFLNMPFNCLGVTAAFILIFVLGVTNSDSDNTEAMYSLARSFEASYIVNMDTGLIRPLRQDIMHDPSLNGMESNDYMTHFGSVLSGILLQEDKEETLAAFDLKNVAKRFKIDSSFTVRYRVREVSGHTVMHSASFMNAAGRYGKHEFLLGIHTLHSESLLYERNETLSKENARLEEVNNKIIESVAKIVEARDSGSGDHIVRVRKLSEIMADEIRIRYPEYKLDEKTVKMIASASVLHDVGKIEIPDAILLKPGRLTPEEFEIMKTHSIKGCEALEHFPLGLDDAFMECAMGICRWHHEKYDGKGYPDGLKGDEIPIAAQIVAVADCFDALVSERPYKKPFTPEKAHEMILNGECGTFNPKLMDCFSARKEQLFELARLYNK